MITVLITCAGSGVGQSVIDSLNLTKEYNIIGCDGKRNVYAHAYCDKFLTVPSIYSDGYIDNLIALSKKEKVDVIIPGHDYELLLFSENYQKFKDNDIEVVVSEPKIIAASRDKQKWFDYFSKHNCKIVPTYSVEAFKQNPDFSIFPAIVKPVGGSASQGILILNNIDELEQANDEDIIQPYLFPTGDDKNYQAIKKAVSSGKLVQLSEISIQLIFSKKSKLSGVFISKNTLKDGVPIFVDTIKPEEFEYLDEIMKFVPVCEEKGVKGPVNIQGRVTSKGIFFFEMNMRFTGITGNRALLGFNEVDYLVKDFLEQPAKIENYSINKVGVRQVACTTIPKETLSAKKTYTLLGAGGFVGQHFIEDLLEKNDDFERINLICRDSSYRKYNERFSDNRIVVYKSSDSFLETIYCQTDVFVNFSSALAYCPDEEIYEAITFQYQQSLKMARANIPVIINVSSQSVYNQSSNEEKTEIAPVKLKTAYAHQKFICEQFFNSLGTNTPVSKVISLRFTRILDGKDNNKINGFFGKVPEVLLKGGNIKIDNPSNNTNLISIKDVVSAIHFVIENSSSKAFPLMMNVGGENISLGAYCNKVISSVKKDETKGGLEIVENVEVLASSMVNIDKFKSYGWQPKYTVDNLIEDFVANIKQSLYV